MSAGSRPPRSGLSARTNDLSIARLPKLGGTGPERPLDRRSRLLQAPDTSEFSRYRPRELIVTQIQIGQVVQVAQFSGNRA